MNDCNKGIREREEMCKNEHSLRLRVFLFHVPKNTQECSVSSLCCTFSIIVTLFEKRRKRSGADLKVCWSGQDV
jgi:hypothetical protein